MVKVENHTVEFKQSWHDEYLKIVAAFANTEGGTIYIGYNDRGEEIGLEKSETKKLLEDLPNKIRSKLGITPFVREEIQNGKSMLNIKVPCSSFPVSYDGKFYIRAGSTTQELSGIELSSFLKNINVMFDTSVRELSLEGVARREIWDYPLDALREAVINALIHRDYLDTSASIEVRIYDDELIVSNPGKLMPPLTIEQLKEKHSGRQRNPLIATVFYYANLIESWGSGILKMITLCKEQNLPEPEFVERKGGPGEFTVVFHKDIFNEEELRKRGLNERQIKAVMYVKEKGKITNKEYQEISKISERTATRDLFDLVSKKIFVQVGSTGKGANYILKTP